MLRKGHTYDAKVVHVNHRIGAFVDLGAVANGLIPLKMLGRTGLNPTDILRKYDHMKKQKI